MDKINVLLVEDNAADMLFLREALAQDVLADFDLVAAESLGEALELLPTQAFAAALLDLGLPDSHGLSTFMKLHQSAPDLPVVVLSALADEEVAMHAVQAGAQDYLVKRPQDFPSAGRALRYAIERQKSRAALRENEARLKGFLDAAPDAMVIVNSGGEIILANIQAEKLFGYERNELLQSELARLIPERYQNAHADNASQFFQQPQTRDMGRGRELFACHKDGHEIAVEISLSHHRLDTETVVLCAIRDITERKYAERKVLESEALLRQVLESTRDSVFAIDRDYRLLVNNERHQKVLTETGGHSLSVGESILPPDYLPEVLEHWRGLYDRTFNGEEFKLESEWPYTDGQQHTIESNFSSLRDATGNIIGALVVIHDITERKLVEKKLRESEHRYTLLFQKSNFPVILVKLPDVVIADANEAAEKLTGFSRKDMIGKNSAELGIISHQQHTELISQFEQAGTLAGNEARIHTKSGEERIISFNTNPMEINGQLFAFTSMQDITERKLAEKKLRESEQRFAAIVEHSPVAIGISRVSDGKIVQINSAFVRLFGFTPEETIGNTTLELGIWVNPADRQSFVETLSAQGYVKGLEITTRIKTGVERQVIVWGELLEIASELCMMVQIVDITERKQAETLLKQRLEDLALINKLNDAVNHGDDLDQVTELLAAETKKIFASQYASVYLIHPDKQALVLQQFTMPQDRIAALEKLIGRPVPLIHIPLGGDDHFNRVLNSDQGLLITGYEAVEHWLADFTSTTMLPAPVRSLVRKFIPAAVRMLNIASVISIPLKAGDEVLGLIEFVTEGRFDEGILERLQNVRHQLAEVIVRKRTEQSLRESNEKYRLLSEELEERVRQRTAEVQDLYNTAPAGYHSLDTHGNLIEINQTQLGWSGYSRTEVLGHSFGILLTPPSRAVFEREFPLFKERGLVRDMEFEMLRKDGSTYPVLVNATAIYDANGNFLMSRSTVFDNTERKQAEQALRESEANLQNFLDSAHDLIQSLDERGNYLYVNTAWCTALGYTEEEALHLTMFDVIAPEHQDVCREMLKKLVVGEAPERMEVVFRTKQGQPVIVEGHVNSLKDKNGHVATSGIFRDITLRKQAEEVLRQSEAQLRISRDKLSAANAALEKAARLKDEFLASMSHELRTPLTGILGLSEALQFNTYGTLTEKQVKAVKNIEESGRHLLALINDILDLSKIEAGMLELNIESVSLADICQASLQLARGMAHKKRQSVDFAMSPDSVHIRGDARRLKQMLVNLLSNAIKFTPENGSLGLEVQADKANQVVRLTVWDTGIGIASENLEKLFQPFVQLESSLARQYEGTGLGLSLVQRMAELHGGSVHVESIPGVGSRFTMLLPWIPGGTQPLSPIRATALRKALLVEDSEIDAGQLTRYLRILGIETVLHTLGQGVIEMAAHEKPDVIFLDLHLPDRSGFEVLAALKADAATRAIPVVICSVEEKRSLAISLGAMGYLLKPLTINDLRHEIQRVASFLGQSSSAAATPQSANPMVLIVDDNEMILETLSDFLEAQNFRTVAARGGAEMLEMLPDLHPHIILMDIQMPGMDGLEATRRVRAHADPQVACIPIIALTALAMTGDRERCLEAGANAYMSKPVSMKQLVELIREFLKVR